MKQSDGTGSGVIVIKTIFALGEKETPIRKKARLSKKEKKKYNWFGQNLLIEKMKWK